MHFSTSHTHVLHGLHLNLQDCYFGPYTLRKMKQLTLTFSQGHRGQSHMAATNEFVYKPGLSSEFNIADRKLDITEHV